MGWDKVIGHESAKERFQRSASRNRVASTYLFVGPDGVGKTRFALQLAKGMLCEQSTDGSIDSCDQCPACQQMDALTHPDLIRVCRPEGKAFIPIELFIGPKEKRHRKGLCHDIGLKPFSGGRKIAIIEDADFLNVEGANCLLKTLEEPPANSILILIGTSEQQQLSTILSRSQVVRFSRLTTDQVGSILEGVELETDVPRAELAAAAGGSVSRAVLLSSEDCMAFRKTLSRQFVLSDPARDGFLSQVMEFVDAAGKDSSAKRGRAALVGDLAIELYEAWLAAASGAETPGVDPFLLDLVADVSGVEDISARVARCIELTVNMQRKVRANVMAKNAIEIWLRDLGRSLRGEIVRESPDEFLLTLMS